MSPPIARTTIAGASGAPPSRRAEAPRPSLCVTATELAEEAGTPRHEIAIEDAGFGAIRPSGKRFGTLVHAVLATLPLDADRRRGRASSPPSTPSCLPPRTTNERPRRASPPSCCSIRGSWPRVRQRRPAAGSGARRRFRLRIDSRTRWQPPHIVDGQIDLAYEDRRGWVVVDFKTDIEIASAQDAYQKQVAMYVEAVRRATGKPATGVLLRV